MHIANDIERLAFAAFCAGFHPADVANGNAAKKWLEWDEDRRRAYRDARAVLEALVTKVDYGAGLVIVGMLRQADWHPPPRAVKGDMRDAEAGAPSASNPMGKGTPDAVMVNGRPLAPDEIWTEWHGGLCPVPLATLVDVHLRNGSAMLGQMARCLGWVNSKQAAASDIIRWRKHRPGSCDAAEPAISDLMRGPDVTVVEWRIYPPGPNSSHDRGWPKPVDRV